MRTDCRQNLATMMTWDPCGWERVQSLTPTHPDSPTRPYCEMALELEACSGVKRPFVAWNDPSSTQLPPENTTFQQKVRACSSNSGGQNRDEGLSPPPPPAAKSSAPGTSARGQLAKNFVPALWVWQCEY